MPGIRQEIQLIDKVSPALSNIVKNTTANIEAYQKLDKRIRDLYGTLDQMYRAGQKNTKGYKMLENAILELDKVQRKLETGEIDLVKAEKERQQQLEATKRKLQEKREAEEQAKAAAEQHKQELREQREQLIAFNQTLELVKKGWNLVKRATQEAYQWMNTYNVQFNAEFTAGNALHTILGYSGESIGELFGYAKELQNKGVVSDEAIIAGMQELSKYSRGTTQAQFKELTKLVTDLAVSENGLNTSMGNITSTAGLMGRALQGQTMLLQRQYGLTDDEVKAFTELNTAEERTNKLLEIMQNHVGNVNEELSNLAEGGLIQTRNKMNELQEMLGKKVTPYIAALEETIYNILKPAVEWLVENFDQLMPLFAGLAAIIGVATIAMTVFALTSAASWLSALGPILLVVGAIGLVIYVLSEVMEAVDDATGQTHNKLGVILGMATSFVAILYNTVIVPIVNIVISIANFIENVFKDPLAAVTTLFIDMGNSILDILLSITNALDAVFGWNLSAGVNSWKNALNAYKQEVIAGSNYEEVYKPLEYWDVRDAAKAGYDFGANLSSNISKAIDDNDFFSEFKEALVPGQNGNMALNTTSSDGLLKDEDIQLLLDLATRDFNIEYQRITPEITLTFGDIHETADVDGIIENIYEELSEEYNSDLEVVMG